ncbi:MAG: hypothetical protein V4472_22055 [Pseudomonadota bacterium]
MKTAILASGLVLFALAGCDKPAQPANSSAPAPTPKIDYLKRINDLPQKQRDAVFYRAIDDAGFECQAVVGSTPRATVQGLPAWVAHCEDKRDWVVVLESDGMMQVATAAQVAASEAKPAAGSSAPAGNATAP